MSASGHKRINKMIPEIIFKAISKHDFKGKIYVYKILDGKKDRHKGIIEIEKFAWIVIKSDEDKMKYIRANFVERFFYKSFFRPFSKLSSSWRGKTDTQKISIIAIIVAIIISIIFQS